MGIVTETSSKESSIDVTARRLMRALVSYLGWPLHFISSVGLLLFDEVLSSLRKYALERQRSSARRIKRRPLRYLVRLRNLPQNHEYFINHRGSLIHVRSYMPDDARSIRAVVLFSHGYGSHCNSPKKHEMGLAMAERGLCVYQMDIEGHGYSGGVRAYIEDHSHLVGDFLQLLELVAGDGGSRAAEARGGLDGVPPFLFDATEEERRRLREVPIFIGGESLGGALSILVGLHLQETQHPLLPRFKGEVLLAPAIRGNPPPAMLVMALRYLVVPIIPRSEIPWFLESVNRSDKLVLDEDARRHAEHDHIGNPGGLGWGGNMRFRTGLALIDLTAEVSRRLDQVAFPFMIMHDPGDCIVQYNSSKELALKARTPKEYPRGRELRPMEGWLHCLLTNCPDQTIEHVSDWILYQTRLHEHQTRGRLYSSAGGGDALCPPAKKSLPASFSVADETTQDERLEAEAVLDTEDDVEEDVSDAVGGESSMSGMNEDVLQDLLIESPSSGAATYSGSRSKGGVISRNAAVRPTSGAFPGMGSAI